MSYLDRIRSCNRHDLKHFRRFMIDGQALGWIRHGLADELRRWPDVFMVQADQVALAPRLDSVAVRTQAVDEVVEALHGEGLIRNSHTEFYPVSAGNRRDQPAMLINRAAAPYFGIRAFGQHLNGYTRRDGQLWMWIARRSAHKWNSPNKLDNLVAGGLPHDLALADNLRKECHEEAGIPVALADHARPVGAISYCFESQAGLKPDVMYCYDLQLPDDFQPVCQDGEVAGFLLLPIEEVAALVRDSEEFKMNCDLVVIDFLVRHGLLGPQEPEYLDIVTGLRSAPPP